MNPKAPIEPYFPSVEKRWTPWCVHGVKRELCSLCPGNKTASAPPPTPQIGTKR